MTETQDTAVANGFAVLGLSPELLAAVADLGFTQPTTVQQQCIGRAMAQEGEGAAFNDLMVSSQTGSGKTAAFLLPVLDTLIRQRAAQEAAEQKAYDEAVARGEAAPKRARKNPLNPRHFKAAVPGALVLCPTRELAQQVASDAIDLVKHTKGLRIANVVGGMPYQMQIARLQNATWSSRRPAACWTCSAPARSSCTRCASSSSTRPTACWTWASPTTWPRSSSSRRSASRR
jgi:superfamily II DNA/RNA helicase